MIGYCKKRKLTILNEIDCIKCEYVDLTCCRYWSDSTNDDIIDKMIMKCFRLGQGGWNTATDFEEYYKMALEYYNSLKEK